MSNENFNNLGEANNTRGCTCQNCDTKNCSAKQNDGGDVCSCAKSNSFCYLNKNIESETILDVSGPNESIENIEDPLNKNNELENNDATPNDEFWAAIFDEIKGLTNQLSNKCSRFSYDVSTKVNDKIELDGKTLDADLRNAGIAYSCKDQTKEKLSAQVMNLPYEDVIPINSIKIQPERNFTKEDIFERIKDAYKACSCKVCECIIADNILRNKECKCKPCHCNDCNDYTGKCPQIKKCRTEFKYVLDDILHKTASCSCKTCNCLVCTDQSSKNCRCDPCQCIDCQSYPLNRKNRMIVVAPVEEPPNPTSGCVCSPCDCMQCRNTYVGMSSNTTHEISTGVNRHQNCQCENCDNETCIPDDTEFCRCQRSTKLMKKPNVKDVRDFDIHMALVEKINDLEHYHGIYKNLLINLPKSYSSAKEKNNSVNNIETTYFTRMIKAVDSKLSMGIYSPPLQSKDLYTQKDLSIYHVSPLSKTLTALKTYNESFKTLHMNVTNNNWNQTQSVPVGKKVRPCLETKSTICHILDNISSNISMFTQSNSVQNIHQAHIDTTVFNQASIQDQEHVEQSPLQDIDTIQNFEIIPMKCNCSACDCSVCNCNNTDPCNTTSNIIDRTVDTSNNFPEVILNNDKEDGRKENLKKCNCNNTDPCYTKILDKTTSDNFPGVILNNNKAYIQKENVKTITHKCPGYKNHEKSISWETFGKDYSYIIEQEGNVLENTNLPNNTYFSDIKAENSNKADLLRVEKLLQDAKNFSLQLMKTLQKYEKANREFQCTTQKLKLAHTHFQMCETIATDEISDHEKPEANEKTIKNENENMFGIEGPISFFDKKYTVKNVENAVKIEVNNNPTQFFSKTHNYNNFEAVIIKKNSKNTKPAPDEVEPISENPKDQGHDSINKRIQKQIGAVISPKVIKSEKHDGVPGFTISQRLDIKTKKDLSSIPEPTDSVLKEIDLEIRGETLAFQLQRKKCSKVNDKVNFGFAGDSNRKNKSNFKLYDSSLKVEKVELKKISDEMVAVQWQMPKAVYNVVGYELLVDGIVVEKIKSPSRCVAFISKLPKTEKILITVRTMVAPKAVRVYPPATNVLYYPLKMINEFESRM